MSIDLHQSFDIHRRWIESIIATPESPDEGSLVERSLTVSESPTEHVLRGSKSFAARSFRSRPSANSLRVPSNKINNENLSINHNETKKSLSSENHPSLGPVLGDIAPNGQVFRPGLFKLRPSPTPSLKKKKAEAIVKAHGSPTHVRVTAGGRIVPSAQSPLCHPRYGYSAIKVNGGLIKFAPNYHAGQAQWKQATENGFVAQDIHGNLCQIVNGTILPLNEVDGALRLYMHAPNVQVTHRGSSLGPIHPSSTQNATSQRSPTQVKSGFPQEPSIASQIGALDLEYSKLEHDLKDVDKTEVLHGRTMGKVAKDALILRRRELVINMDKIRKALKELKHAAPADAPTSPRAMAKQMPMSSPRNRLPAFLNQQHPGPSAAVPVHQGYAPFLNGLPPMQFSNQYGLEPAAARDEGYETQPWAMPPPTMFVPPPFDGPTAPLFPSFQPNVNHVVPTQQPAPPGAEDTIPQHDGSQSLADSQTNLNNRSHAVSIKVPESIRATSLKSNLNPMSPIYKPTSRSAQASATPEKPAGNSIANRVPTPLSPLHQLQSNGYDQDKPNHANPDTASPTKKTAHLNSSSVSSFETADFFPRNTREYSTRQHAYSFREELSEDKENAQPEQHALNHGESPNKYPQTRISSQSQAGLFDKTLKDHLPLKDDSKLPAAPPGTPVCYDNASGRDDLPNKASGTKWERRNHAYNFEILPDREANNISPKNKRGYFFIEEHPENMPSSSPCKVDPHRDELCVTGSSPGCNNNNIIDFTQKPREWIEGYQAGLQRRPVGGDRTGDFLDGYCSGLLKSKPSNTGPSPNFPSTESPMKSASRRHSPAAPRYFSGHQHGENFVAGDCPPSETNTTGVDTFKQAVFGPQNENAILTPAADGPHANDPPFNLGAWEKNQQLALEKARQSAGIDAGPSKQSMLVMGRQRVFSEDNNESKGREANRALELQHDISTNPQPTAHRYFSEKVEQQNQSLYLNAGNASTGDMSHTSGNRIGSMVSIDSALYRPWTGHRVFSPHLEWKSASSVAHAASLAAGLFANAQFDGKHYTSSNSDPFKLLTHSVRYSGTPQSQHSASVNRHIHPVPAQHSRFKEGSLDGITNPPTSPPMSPRESPAKHSGTKKKASSPIKGPSPAKAKFEHIAEKVGIKVSTTSNPKAPDDTTESGSEPVSPVGKRRWRDVWRGGLRKDSCNHDGA